MDAVPTQRRFCLYAYPAEGWVRFENQQDIAGVALTVSQLDVVLRGLAGDALLDSYGTERKDRS